MVPIKDKRWGKKNTKLFELPQKIRLTFAFFDLFVPLSTEVRMQNYIQPLQIFLFVQPLSEITDYS